MEYKVISSEVFKQGTGSKGPWAIYQVQLEGYPGNHRITGFDAVQPGQLVTVEATQNGEYTNYNYKIVKGASPTATAPSKTTGVAGSDPRALKLLVLIAEQVGVSPDEIAAVLEG